MNSYLLATTNRLLPVAMTTGDKAKITLRLDQTYSARRRIEQAQGLFSSLGKKLKGQDKELKKVMDGLNDASNSDVRKAPVACDVYLENNQIVVVRKDTLAEVSRTDLTERQKQEYQSDMLPGFDHEPPLNPKFVPECAEDPEVSKWASEQEQREGAMSRMLGEQATLLDEILGQVHSYQKLSDAKPATPAPAAALPSEEATSDEVMNPVTGEVPFRESSTPDFDADPVSVEPVVDAAESPWNARPEDDFSKPISAPEENFQGASIGMDPPYVKSAPSYSVMAAVDLTTPEVSPEALNESVKAMTEAMDRPLVVQGHVEVDGEIIGQAAQDLEKPESAPVPSEETSNDEGDPAPYVNTQEDAVHESFYAANLDAEDQAAASREDAAAAREPVPEDEPTPASEAIQEPSGTTAATATSETVTEVVEAHEEAPAQPQETSAPTAPVVLADEAEHQARVNGLLAKAEEGKKVRAARKPKTATPVATTEAKSEEGAVEETKAPPVAAAPALTAEEETILAQVKPTIQKAVLNLLAKKILDGQGVTTGSCQDVLRDKLKSAATPALLNSVPLLLKKEAAENGTFEEKFVDGQNVWVAKE